MNILRTPLLWLINFVFLIAYYQVSKSTDIGMASKLIMVIAPLATVTIMTFWPDAERRKFIAKVEGIQQIVQDMLKGNKETDAKILIEVDKISSVLNKHKS